MKTGLMIRLSFRGDDVMINLKPWASLLQFGSSFSCMGAALPYYPFWEQYSRLHFPRGIAADVKHLDLANAVARTLPEL